MSRGEEKAKGSRPWRFSLRFLLLLTFGVASFFGGWQANEFRRRAKPVPTKVNILPLVDIQQMTSQQMIDNHRQMIDNQKLLDKWELMEHQKRFGFPVR